MATQPTLDDGLLLDGKTPAAAHAAATRAMRQFFQPHLNPTKSEIRAKKLSAELGGVEVDALDGNDALEKAQERRDRIIKGFGKRDVVLTTDGHATTTVGQSGVNNLEIAKHVSSFSSVWVTQPYGNIVSSSGEIRQTGPVVSASYQFGRGGSANQFSFVPPPPRRTVTQQMLAQQKRLEALHDDRDHQQMVAQQKSTSLESLHEERDQKVADAAVKAANAKAAADLAKAQALEKFHDGKDDQLAQNMGFDTTDKVALANQMAAKEKFQDRLTENAMKVQGQDISDPTADANREAQRLAAMQTKSTSEATARDAAVQAKMDFKEGVETKNAKNQGFDVSDPIADAKREAQRIAAMQTKSTSDAAARDAAVQAKMDFKEGVETKNAKNAGLDISDPIADAGREEQRLAAMQTKSVSEADAKAMQVADIRETQKLGAMKTKSASDMTAKTIQQADAREAQKLGAMTTKSVSDAAAKQMVVADAARETLRSDAMAKLPADPAKAVKVNFTKPTFDVPARPADHTDANGMQVWNENGVKYTRFPDGATSKQTPGVSISVENGVTFENSNTERKIFMPDGSVVVKDKAASRTFDAEGKLVSEKNKLPNEKPAEEKLADEKPDLVSARRLTSADYKKLNVKADAKLPEKALDATTHKTADAKTDVKPVEAKPAGDKPAEKADAAPADAKPAEQQVAAVKPRKPTSNPMLGAV